MKERVSILTLMNFSNPKELKLIFNLIKNHNYFKGERRKMYKLIVKYKKTKRGNK